MLNIIINISLVILILSVLVFIHELGHYLAAKAINAKVFEFAIGMGPKLFSFFIGETEYSFRALPIGGYVRIYGEG
ncbi:MAG TPA: site-2 protease family protein, partial [Candidatus Dojkabacteria bacterium]|nr:site-2 protease family protein [Candidatus Dojkabacteria bacterium]